LLPIIKPLAIVLGVTLVGSLEVLALALRGITDVLNAVATVIGWVIKGIVAVFQWLYDKLLGHSIIPDIVNGIAHWFGKAHDFIVHIFNKIKDFFVSIWNHIKDFIANRIADVIRIINRISELPGKVWGWIKKVYDSISHWFGEAVHFVTGIPGKLLHALGNLGSILWNAGKAIIGGLLGGLKSKFEDVKGFVGGIGSWISDHKGPIDYDAKLLLPHGMAIINGLVKGLKSRRRHLEDEIHGVTNLLKNHKMSKVTEDVLGHMLKTMKSRRGQIDKELKEISKAIRNHKIPNLTMDSSGGVSKNAPTATSSKGGSSHKASTSGSRIGVYIAKGAFDIHVNDRGHGKQIANSISNKLTRTAKFGAFDQAG
jgi:hypothetical protein